MLAALGLGCYADYPAVVAGMTSIRETVLPIPRNRALYAQLYERVYRNMYAQLKPLYKNMADIAGKFSKENQSHATIR